MARKAMLLVVLAVFASAATGGTVYLRDGRKLVGKVTRSDGKITVEMELGTVVVDESEVIYVSDAVTVRTRPAPRPVPHDDLATADVLLQPSVEWNIASVTLPQPAAFAIARQIELLAAVGEDTTGLKTQLGQWRIFAHDGKRKVGAEWLSREDQRRYRDRFLEAAKEASDLSRQAQYVRERTPAEKARKSKLEAQAREAWTKAARVWPDDLLRDFLTAVLELQAERYGRAERLFYRCTEREPLVAAFHQGRGLALGQLTRHRTALAEFLVCFRLRDDDWEAYRLVQQGMKAVPGQYTKQEFYRKAKETLDRYEKPRQAPRRFGTGISWLLPGPVRQSRGDVVPSLPYDRIVARQAMAVPIAGEGVLVLAEEALTGAELVYVQLGQGVIVRAEPPRTYYGYGASKAAIPLQTITVPGVRFTSPVDLTKLPPLKEGQTVSVRAVGLYRQMGTEVRTGEAKVLATGPDGAKLSSGLHPGEPAAPVFVDDKLVGFLTGRCDPDAKDFGTSRLMKPSDLADWASKRGRSPGYRSSYARGPVLKKDAPPQTAEGQVFPVHVLTIEKPPTQLGK